MGKVSEYITGLIKRQVDEKGIVVWYDPECHYTSIVNKWDVLLLPLVKYDKSYFKLRHEIEAFIEFVAEDGTVRPDAGIPPRLVVYVPKARNETANALIEAECAGVVVEPGSDSLPRNTRLSVIARNFFKQHIPGNAEEYARQVENRSLSLADLDRLAEQVSGAGVGALSLIFGAVMPDDVILAFAATDTHDKAIDEKNAIPDITALILEELGLDLASKNDPAALRAKLRRSVLFAECLAAMTERDRKSVSSDSSTQNDKVNIEAVRRLVHQWRNRIDFRESYVESSWAVEREVKADKLPIPEALLSDLETFPCFEDMLIALSESHIIENRPQAALAHAQKRKSMFWPSHDGIYRLRWQFVEIVSQFFLLSTSILDALKASNGTVDIMVLAYTDGSTPWCILDTHYRHIERLFDLIEYDVSKTDDKVEFILASVRNRYGAVVHETALALTAVYAQNGFTTGSFVDQKTVYKSFIESCLNKKQKTAYFLVDALRYEMGRELIEGLEGDFSVEIQPGIAQLPTVTEIGMACLLPEAEKGVAIIIDNDSPVISIGQNRMTSRNERIAYLEEKSGVATVTYKLGDILRISKKIKDDIKDAVLVVITSQEIDQIGEKTDDFSIGRYSVDILDNVRKALRRVASLGVKNIVITADHGFLHVDAMPSGMKIDAPGGATYSLHRRAWMGKGGRADDSYLRVNASSIGLAGDFECVFPKGMSCFKVRGGNESYMHGGISLQEMVIPIIRLKTKDVIQPQDTAGVTVKYEKKEITNRFFSVIILYTADVMFPRDELIVRVSIVHDAEDAGIAVMAGYGFNDATKEITLLKDKPNSVTLMLTGTVPVGFVTIHVVDINTDMPCASINDIPVKLTI